MFTFNFGGEVKSGAHQNASVQVVQDAYEEPSLEISLTDVHLTFDWREVACDIKVEDVEITVVDSTKIVEHLKTVGCGRLSALEADKDNSDLIPGVYEGGMKIWECTYDLGTYLRQTNVHFENRTVLDLGCGAGILGIIALKLGSSCVHFQDYNSEVLLHSTVPSVLLNGSQLPDRCKFWSGDWKSYEEADNTKFDVILASETIYNPTNHLKLHSVLRKKLKPGGSMIDLPVEVFTFVAGKSYYFGVGGSMKGFREVVESQRVFSCDTVWTSVEGVKREIILLKHISAS